ncbi:hypothetical protein M422DRAFT_236637, partial [Sphaerobolus stellatus SS14]
MDTRSDGELFRLVRLWIDPKPRPCAVSLLALSSTFRQRINQPAVLPPRFDPLLHAINESFLSRPVPVDNTPQLTFSTPFLEKEIAAAKVILDDTSRTSSVGIDGITYRALLQIPNAELTIMANECITTSSCTMLKLITLIDRRIRDWLEPEGLLPPSQNGFRAKYRTCNNTFILCCLIDKSVATNSVIFTVFVDLTNAFPSTHRATLWRKMQRLGAGGPI